MDSCSLGLIGNVLIGTGVRGLMGLKAPWLGWAEREPM